MNRSSDTSGSAAGIKTHAFHILPNDPARWVGETDICQGEGCVGALYEQPFGFSDLKLL